VPHLHFNITFTYFPELSFKTSNSSEHHTFYLKTASNIESSLVKDKHKPAPSFHLSKITATTTKNQEIARNNEEKYSLIHLPQNLQQQNDIYTRTHPNYPLI
jgi:hypothetical protein